MSDQGFELSEDAEIQADLDAQGLGDEVSVEDVKATFNLYKTMPPPSMESGPPLPAQGQDWRYTPEPGEEELFSDTSDMFFPPD